MREGQQFTRVFICKIQWYWYSWTQLIVVCSYSSSCFWWVLSFIYEYEYNAGKFSLPKINIHNLFISYHINIIIIFKSPLTSVKLLTFQLWKCCHPIVVHSGLCYVTCIANEPILSHLLNFTHIPSVTATGKKMCLF